MVHNYTVEEINGKVHISFYNNMIVRLRGGSKKNFSSITFSKKDPQVIKFENDSKDSFYVKVSELKDIDFLNDANKDCFYDALNNKEANSKVSFTKSVKDYLAINKKRSP